MLLLAAWEHMWLNDTGRLMYNRWTEATGHGEVATHAHNVTENQHSEGRILQSSVLQVNHFTDIKVQMNR